MKQGCLYNTCTTAAHAGIILGMDSANETQCYNEMSSLIDSIHIQNYPWQGIRLWYLERIFYVKLFKWRLILIHIYITWCLCIDTYVHWGMNKVAANLLTVLSNAFFLKNVLIQISNVFFPDRVQLTISQTATSHYQNKQCLMMPVGRNLL